MTFNSSQQERLLAALERLADTAVRIADALEARTDQHLRVTYTPTDPNSTKGPYR